MFLVNLSECRASLIILNLSDIPVPEHLLNLPLFIYVLFDFIDCVFFLDDIFLDPLTHLLYIFDVSLVVSEHLLIVLEIPVIIRSVHCLHIYEVEVAFALDLIFEGIACAFP